MELGALDGSPNTHSMTYDFEKSMGWRRILVEGDPSYRQRMLQLSPKLFQRMLQYVNPWVKFIS